MKNPELLLHLADACGPLDDAYDLNLSDCDFGQLVHAMNLATILEMRAARIRLLAVAEIRERGERPAPKPLGPPQPTAQPRGTGL